MKKTLFILASALAIVCACSKEIAPSENAPAKKDIVIPEGYTLYELTSNLSKLAIDGLTLSWEAGDSIKLITDKGQYVSQPLTAGGTSASFSFVIPEGDTPLFGVSPANLSTSVVKEDSGDTLKVVFPTNKSAKLSSANVMCGKVDAGSIAFKNIAHLIKFETQNANMTRVQFCESTGSKVTTGEVAVVFDNEDITIKRTGKNESRSFSSTVEGAGTYYIAVLPTGDSWAGFGIRTATGTPSNYSYSTGFIGTKSIIPTRNTITNLGNIDGIFETEVSPKDGAELRSLLNIDNNTAKCWYLNGKTVNLGAGTYQVDSSYIYNNNINEGVNFKLVGQGADKTIIDANKAHKIFFVGNKVRFDASGITFQNGFSTTDGGGIVFNATTVFGQTTFKNCTFKDNKTINGVSGGAIAVQGAKVIVDNCNFTGNYARNGACLYTSSNDNAYIEASNSNFKSNNSFNTGGVANITRGTQKYKNCAFESNTTAKGTGGAFHINASNAVMTVDNCTFKENEACKDTSYLKRDNKAIGGAISIQEGDLTINGCTFDGNKGVSGSAILIQSGSGFVKVNNSTFKNNKGASRGLIQTNGKGVIFLNNCKFYDNYMRTNAWGRILHGGNPSAACFNNCTIYNNTTGATGGNSVCLNNDGSTIVVNSTVINSNALALVRNTNATADVLIANSVLINTYSTTSKVFSNSHLSCTTKTYNCYLGAASDTPANWTSTNDKKYITALPGFSFNTETGTYLWNGPDGTFTKAKESDVKGYLNTMTRNNGNTRVDGAFGPKFAAWVESLGGFEKDMLGTTRTTTGTWPGAIEIIK